MTRSTLVALGVISALIATTGRAGDSPPQFSGEVDVVRLLVDLRAIDRNGDQVSDLTADDFRIEIDGTPTIVESAEWIPHRTPSARPASEWPGQVSDAGLAAPQAGRLVVILVQVGYQHRRLSGLHRVARRAELLLDAFGPDDRIALAVFSSHLELHHDLTNDFDQLRDRMRITQLLRTGVVAAPSEGPSLTPFLSPDRGLAAATPEQAITAIGNALTSFPGPKSVIMIGWGLGRLTRMGVTMGPDWEDAFAALATSRTSMFVLDVTDADYHSLEVGLRGAARQTGGTYDKTWLFPKLAIERVGRVLSGRYELSVVIDHPSERGWFELAAEVDRPGVRILAPPIVVARPG